MGIIRDNTQETMGELQERGILSHSGPAVAVLEELGRGGLQPHETAPYLAKDQTLWRVLSFLEIALTSHVQLPWRVLSKQVKGFMKLMVKGLKRRPATITFKFFSTK